MKIQESLGLLGCRVRDKVTGLSGIVTSISFDLYGCIQAIVHQGLNDKGELIDKKWFDVNRLTVINGEPVMEQPTFDSIPGPAEKPSFNKN